MCFFYIVVILIKIMVEKKPAYIPPKLHDLWPELDPEVVWNARDVIDSPEFQEDIDRLRALRTSLELTGQLIPGHKNSEFEQAMAAHLDLLTHKGFNGNVIAAAISSSYGELILPPRKKQRME